jgi:hypothetical protein
MQMLPSMFRSSNTQALQNHPVEAYKRILREERMTPLEFMCDVHGDREYCPFTIPEIYTDKGASGDISSICLHILLNDKHREYIAYRRIFSEMMTALGLKFLKIDQSSLTYCQIKFSRLKPNK